MYRRSPSNEPVVDQVRVVTEGCHCVGRAFSCVWYAASLFCTRNLLEPCTFWGDFNFEPAQVGEPQQLSHTWWHMLGDIGVWPAAPDPSQWLIERVLTP